MNKKKKQTQKTALSRGERTRATDDWHESTRAFAVKSGSVLRSTGLTLQSVRCVPTRFLESVANVHLPERYSNYYCNNNIETRRD